MKTKCIRVYNYCRGASVTAWYQYVPANLTDGEIQELLTGEYGPQGWTHFDYLTAVRNNYSKVTV